GPLPAGTFRVAKSGKISYRLSNRSPFKITGTIGFLSGHQRIGLSRFKLRANRSADVIVTLVPAARRRIANGAKLKATAIVSATGPARSKATARRGITLRKR
ncbi:MAG: hypothetical protein QOE38_2536, partial [Thermoleophilaceae bacterium]|nr:hypothetical protein [Thermoleophilaceae bacterium]